MSKALVTFAVDGYERLAELTRPGLVCYAARHGYDLYHGQPVLPADRAPSWAKIRLLQNALDEYEQVLWLDADVAIVDDTDDLADRVPGWAWQAMVRHRTPDGEVPNCGVWLVRPPMWTVLEQAWRTGDPNDPWWEQAAMLPLLGYRGRPCRLEMPTALYRMTCWLGLEWNSHEQCDPHPAPRFAHATCGPLEWRLNVIRDHLAERGPVNA
jgi:hypothetical protein